MMIPPEVKSLLSKPGFIGTLSTADREGVPDVACFGSIRVLDDRTIALGFMNNRSLANLRENPQAVYFAIERSPVLPTTPGFRLYLRVREVREEGPVLDSIRQVVAGVSKQAADALVAGVVFDVAEIRPLLDWPK